MPKRGWTVHRRYYLFLILCFISTTCLSSINFSDLAWKNVNNILKKIEQHPFNESLLNGTLPETYFKRFLQQDAYYLLTYEKLARDVKAQLRPKQLNRLLLEKSISREKALRLQGRPIALTMANYSYTRFLTEVEKKKNPALIVAAMLPCQWIYQFVYRVLPKRKLTTNPYYSWLKVYQNSDYINTTLQFIKLANQLYQHTDSNTKTQMLEIFTQAAIFEYRFWDDVYRENYMR
jgi:thiaminase